MDRESKIFIAGHKGMVGSAILRKLKEEGFTNLVTRSSSDLDLRDREAVFSFFTSEKPFAVYLAAAKVGGILANDMYPAEFLSDNLRIQVNVMDAAHEFGVEKLLFLGSNCIYPKLAPQPIPESALMTGHLESTNDAYAVAKIAGIQQVKAMRKEYGHSWISVMPPNLYGPGDNYSPESSHVLPALIMRYELARLRNEPVVVNWGSGKPRREFLYVEDLADACLFLMDHYDEDEHINVGTGTDARIEEIAKLVAETVGFSGSTQWDLSKPDGTPRKLQDISRINALGWASRTDLKEGVALAVADFRSRFGEQLHNIDG